MSGKSVPTRQCIDEFKVDAARLAESVSRHEAACPGLRARDIVGVPFTQLAAHLALAISLLWACARTFIHAEVGREFQAARTNRIVFP